MILFIILATLAIASAILTISHKNPLKSAISLVSHFIILAGIYLSINAQFVAVAQVLVYAGAIMVLILFAIMLLNLRDEKSSNTKRLKSVLILLPIGLFVSISAIIVSGNASLANLPEQTGEMSTAQSLGQILYGDYVFAVMGIGFLLTAAIIGAVMLAKKPADEK